ncbi:MAG: hypothetical protein IH612_16905 [Desulfofustis sp.]|nr:hypothetical protein [Desulfofustis sp.]
MPRMPAVKSLFLFFILTLLVACSDSGSNATSALNAENINLIFVVSPDLAYSTAGDINTETANLSNQGLQRSLRMATYLKQQVLGGRNVNGIYTISPMSHLQTTSNYPDMAAIGFIQQFALLNRITLHVDGNGNIYTANSYPINSSYAREEGVPNGVALPTSYCTDCSGLDFSNAAGINDTLVAGIMNKETPGYYVFSAPWETVSAMLAKINTEYGYNLNLPTTYMGTNYIYAISIPTSGKASLVTYNSKLNPPATYPVLPSAVPSTACTHSLQPYYRLVLYNGMTGVTMPSEINRNTRIYIVRHAEAHPDPAFGFDDGNYVAAGQWRALSLANALRGKIAPNAVYSIDPAGMWYPNRDIRVSYTRPSLTVLPYAIANNLPYSLAAGLSLGNPFNPTEEDVAINTSDFFFTGGTFSNQTLLVAWESGHIKPFINELIKSYGITDPTLLLPVAWPSEDYDTIWTVTLDAQGNLTVDNELCEGVDSANLPDTAPMF